MEDFEGKKLETLHIVSNSLDFEPNNTSFFRKIFLRVLTTVIRASSRIICGKYFIFPEKFCLLFEIWSCSVFLVPCQINYLSESKQHFTCLDERTVENLLWKTVFLIVWTLSRETWTFYGKLIASFSKL